MTSFEPRAATSADVNAICQLLEHYAAQGDLLPRSEQDVRDNLALFRVIDGENGILACGSLEHFTEELAEIRSLMVDQNAKGRGLGREIVLNLLEFARTTPTKRVMALTYVPEFFHSMGFETVSKQIFPEKVWGICVNCYKFHNCDEIAVLLNL